MYGKEFLTQRIKSIETTLTFANKLTKSLKAIKSVNFHDSVQHFNLLICVYKPLGVA